MDVLFMLVGVLLVVAAAVLVMVYLDKGSVPSLGAGIVLAALGALAIFQGWHGENVKFSGKHDAIVRSLHAQGYPEPAQVSAKGGENFDTTYVEYAVGDCTWRLVLSKDSHGAWHPAVARTDGGVVFLSPADLAKLAAVC